MIKTERFDFGRLVDGLTIEIQVNEGHRQALRIRMIERFETRQGQRWVTPTMKVAAVIALGFGLVGIGLVVQQRTLQRSVQTEVGRVHAAANAHDLETLTGYLNSTSVTVQMVVIEHLAVLGDATTIAELETFLRTCENPRVRAAARAAIRTIRERLQAVVPAVSSEPDSVSLPLVVQPQAEAQPVSREGGQTEPVDFRLTVIDDETGQPLDNIHVRFSWPQEKRETLTDPRGVCTTAWGQAPPLFPCPDLEGRLRGTCRRVATR